MLLVSSAQLPALSLPKNRALPRSSSTSNNSSSRPLQSLPKPLRAGFWLAAILTRSEIKFWETDRLSLLTNSLVATRFRILFRTVKLKSFQRWSRRGHQAKQQLQARARRQKRRQRASKGDRGETKGCKLGKQGGGDKFERARRNRDSQRYLKAKTVRGRESKAMGRGTTRHGAAGQDDLYSIVYIWAPDWSNAQLKHIFLRIKRVNNFKTHKSQRLSSLGV